MNLGGTIHITKTGICVLLGSIIIITIYMLPNRTTDLSKTKIEKISLIHLLTVAIAAAQGGGNEVVRLLNDIQISSKGKTKEGANDSVTTADFKSHCVMMHTIKEIFPSVKIVSEEDVICNKDKQYYVNLTIVDPKDQVDVQDVTVWIDPLDATQEYTEKLTEFVTTMVCIAVKGKPTIGVIHKPFSNQTFWAWVDHAHSPNLLPKTHTGEKFKFIVSRSHTGEVHSKIQTMFKDNVGDIVTAGGAGYKVLEVVNGNADIYLHVTAIKKWDICAGNTILNALGGTMTTLKGHKIDYADSHNTKNEDGIIASMLQSLNIDFV